MFHLFLSWTIPHQALVHGYSLLRPQLNNEYFHDLFDKSYDFDVPLEGHRP